MMNQRILDMIPVKEPQGRLLEHGALWDYIPLSFKTRGHFTPCKADKRPLLKNWPEKGLGFDELRKRYSNYLPGLMIQSSEWFCVDLDHALNESGELKPDAKKLIQKLRELAGASTYWELSDSKRGLHIFYKVSKRPENIRYKPVIDTLPNGTDVDFFTGKTGSGKYIILTGYRIGDTAEPTNGNKVLDYLLSISHSEAKQDRGNVNHDAHKGEGKPARPSVEIALSRMPEELSSLIRAKDYTGIREFIREHSRSARQEFLFHQLFDEGDIEAYGGDRSRADQALMNILLFWTGGDFQTTIGVFMLSALAKDLDRKKGHEQDYLKRTFLSALKSWNGKVYGQETLTNLSLTDEGNAHRIALVYEGKLLYCSNIGKWMLYTGKLWEEVNLERVYEIVGKVMDRAKAEWQAAGMDEKGLKFFTNSKNTAKKKATLEQLQGLLYASTKDFDKNPWLLNCQNGVLDLRTGKLLPHSAGLMLSKICNAALPPAGTASPPWEQTIKQIIPDNALRHYLQKYIGYCLTGSAREENFLIMHGPGGTGKGTFIETVQKVLGSYARPVNVDMFLSYRNDANSGEGATPILAALENIRLVVASESGEGRKFNEAKIKLLTGGDAITARRLHQAPTTYQPAFKVVIQTNYIPDVSNVNDKGITRRMLIAPFRQKLTEEQRNLKLKEELSKPENLNAVLRWCVDGCLMWQKEGLTGTEPAAMNQVRDEYLADRDYIGDFLESCCEYKADAQTYLKDLYQGFCEWYGGTERTAPVTRKRFGVILRERLDLSRARYIRTKKGYAFNGLQFNLEQLYAEDDFLK